MLRTNHKRNTDDQLTFLVLHMAQQTIALVDVIGGIVMDQMVPGRWIDKVPDMVSFVYILNLVLKVDSLLNK